jgi:hypothetical protein
MDQIPRAPLKANELNAINLIDASVYNAEDEKIGKIAHVYGEGLAVEVIAEVGGTLLIGPKPVSLLVSQLEFTREANGLVHVQINLSGDELGVLLQDTPPERR